MEATLVPPCLACFRWALPEAAISGQLPKRSEFYSMEGRCRARRCVAVSFSMPRWIYSEYQRACHNSPLSHLLKACASAKPGRLPEASNPVSCCFDVGSLAHSPCRFFMTCARERVQLATATVNITILSSEKKTWIGCGFGVCLLLLYLLGILLVFACYISTRGCSNLNL